MIIPKPVWADILRGSQNGLVQFVHSAVPVNWGEWAIPKRREWWSDADFRRRAEYYGLTRKRDRISAVEVWCEYYGYEAQDLTQRHARMLNDTLASIPGLERVKTNLKCGPYGLQRGFYVW